MDPIGSVVGGLLSTAAQGIGNFFMAERQNEAQRKLWQEQTAYNAPAAQVSRLREAGLNPALAYGKGTLTNVAGAPPSMQRSEAPNPAENVSAYQQVVNANVQQDLIHSQAAAARANADKAEAEAAIAWHDADIIVGSPVPSNSPWEVRTGAGLLDRARAWWDKTFPKDDFKTGMQIRPR